MPVFKKMEGARDGLKGKELYVNMDNVSWAKEGNGDLKGTVYLEFGSGDGGIEVKGTIEEVLFDRGMPVASKAPEAVEPYSKSTVLVVGLFFNSDGLCVQSVSEVFAGPRHYDAGTNGFHCRILREIRSACRNTPEHVLVFTNDPPARRKLVTEFCVDLIAETPIE